ncbi:hypothetical protein D1007_40665 [Hordeum vulgare]|nr:hypothetical protein D1007_40665 [Hordeum vulgare]
MCSTPSIFNHHQQAEKNGSPSFDLSRSFHGDEDISKDLSTPLNPCNLDAYMVESEDDWGLDPQELHKACLEAEAQFAKKKEKEKLDTEERSGNKGQINDQDASTPTIETSPVAATHVPSSSRTPAAVRNERRVKPIINYDEFFISCIELANCMVPGWKMDSIVTEVAIIALREPGLRLKKRIMPLRITIAFPTLEILDKANPKESGH